MRKGTMTVADVREAMTRLRATHEATEPNWRHFTDGEIETCEQITADMERLAERGKARRELLGMPPG